MAFRKPRIVPAKCPGCPPCGSISEQFKQSLLGCKKCLCQPGAVQNDIAKAMQRVRTTQQIRNMVKTTPNIPKIPPRTP